MSHVNGFITWDTYTETIPRILKDMIFLQTRMLIIVCHYPTTEEFCTIIDSEENVVKLE